LSERIGRTSVRRVYLGFVVLLVWAYCSVVTIRDAVAKNKAREEQERAAKNR
jgi:hypothetical protein